MTEIFESALKPIRAVWRAVIILFEWIMIAIGLGLGLYVGAYVMFFGGVADAINLFKAESSVTALDVIVATSKILFALPVGYIVAYIPISISAAVISRLTELDLAGLPRETITEKRKRLGYEE